MSLFKSILSAAAMLAAAATVYGYAHDGQLAVVGAISFGASLIPLAYDKLVVRVALKDGSEVTVDASRVEK